MCSQGVRCGQVSLRASDGVQASAGLPPCTQNHCLPSPSTEYKLGKNIKIAMLYLEDEDAVSAEQYIKKASSLLSACKVRGQCGIVTGLEHSAGCLSAPVL